MKDDKKKLAIVGVLGFIVVGVGAFQFMGGGGGSAPAKPAKTTKPATAADKKDEKGIKNVEFATALPARDPFKAPAGSGVPDPVSKLPIPAAKHTASPSHLGGHLSDEMLPGATGGGYAPVSLAPTQPTFGYRLSGLISGHHPAAVFTDSSGAQRLVPLNGSLDGDTQLVAVQKGQAVVSFRGKHLKLSLGGTPDAN